jgi:hypothetical protein
MRELEAYLAGTLSPPERAAAIEHAAAEDGALREWIEARRRIADELERDPRAKPFEALVEEAGAAPRSRAPWFAALGVAVAAAAAIVLMPREPTVRVRGGVTVRAMVLENGAKRALESGAKLAPKSRVRLKIEDAVGGYATVLLQESTGRAERLYDATELGRIEPPGRTLPEALELDDHRGRERLYVVLCETDHDTTVWPAALQSRGFEGGWTPPDDCRLGVIEWEKVAP